jgi:CCAAT-binding transcription factor (CBF-B/NF-YA) subunit B
MDLGAGGEVNVGVDATAVMAAAAAMQPDDQPTYVNPKQYHRILKRRESRKKATGTDLTMYTPRRRNYLHLSRHNHACHRQRGAGGRFLSLKEREALAAEDNAALAVAEGENGSTGGRLGSVPAPGAGPGASSGVLAGAVGAGAMAERETQPGAECPV